MPQLPDHRSLGLLALAMALVACSAQPLLAQSPDAPSRDGPARDERALPPPASPRTQPFKIPSAPPDRQPEPQRKAEPSKRSPGVTGQQRKEPTADTPAARARALSDLYAHLAAAGDTAEASAIASAIEVLWIHSGSDTVALLLSRTTEAIAAKRPDQAHRLLDAVVTLAPDFAEGFARRAFLFYSENDTTRALGDLRRALALDPNHYRALDGLVTILNDIGEKRAALQALKQLRDVHPYWPGLDETLRELERAVEGQGI